jgi:hypothetical protein
MESRDHGYNINSMVGPGLVECSYLEDPIDRNPAMSPILEHRQNLRYSARYPYWFTIPGLEHTSSGHFVLKETSMAKGGIVQGGFVAVRGSFCVPIDEAKYRGYEEYLRQRAVSYRRCCATG